jgi:hypothetical protein
MIQELFAFHISESAKKAEIRIWFIELENSMDFGLTTP